VETVEGQTQINLRPKELSVLVYKCSDPLVKLNGTPNGTAPLCSRLFTFARLVVPFVSFVTKM